MLGHLPIGPSEVTRSSTSLKEKPIFQNAKTSFIDDFVEQRPESYLPG